MNPKTQSSKYSSPWPIWVHILLGIWKLTWLIFCAWTPKFLNPWRILVLKVFGAKIYGLPFVHSSAKIRIPWHLILHHRACVGENVQIYSLAEIEICAHATIAQEAYLCTGTHDFNTQSFQLVTKKIRIGENSFVGVRALILPGVSVSRNAIIGAQAVLTKDVMPSETVAGNPAKRIDHENLK